MCRCCLQLHSTRAPEDQCSPSWPRLSSWRYWEKNADRFLQLLLFNLSMPKTFLNIFALPRFPHGRHFLGYQTVKFYPIEKELTIEVPCISYLTNEAQGSFFYHQSLLQESSKKDKKVLVRCIAYLSVGSSCAWTSVQIMCRVILTFDYLSLKYSELGQTPT